MGLLRLRPLPAPLRLRDPSVLIATWFGVGLLPKAPGTWGSVAALIVGAAIAWAAGPFAGPVLLLAAAAAFVAGTIASDRYATAAGRDDPSEVVIDEVAALWLVLAALPFDFVAYLAGFGLFRLFDILKPWPVSLADRRLKGGLGIMADDVLAALYALGCLAVLAWLTGGFPH